MTLSLPRFIFIVGDRTQELADAIIADLEPGPIQARVLVSDLQEPLQSATTDLFFPEHLFNMDYTKPEVMDAQVVKGTTLRVREWLEEFRSFIKARCGAAVLSQLAIKFYVENGHEELFSHIIYTNLTSGAEVVAFADTFSAADCIILNAGPMTTLYKWPPDLRMIWLATPETPGRMAQLRRELEPTP